MIQKRTLGHSNLKVSEISLGCMNLGTNVKQAENIIQTALDQGINYLDTADLYDFGENEKIVGQAIKGKRDQVMIATKGGNHFEPGQEGWYWDPSKSYLKEAFKNSLQRLGLDYIDLYQLHGGTIDDPTDEVIEAFEELQQDGLIRYYGISSIRPNVIKKFVEKSNITSVMMQYSLLDRRPEEEILELLKEHQIGVVARGALGKGMLTHHGQTQWQKKGQDGFLDYNGNELKSAITSLQDLAHESGISPQALAIGYALKHPTLSSLVLGASDSQQVIDNVRAYQEAQISNETYERLKQITKANIYQNHRI
ncbi:aryl-alcohol dehydrogenase-like predicted oxidoreductase [Aquisalibacillus elongatus]|uniref:Aryl-alcohol dehydrogenase-like predicted oxidoreductase n=1 Tax=Aquisalibacillus elongatus TaxID=485577 RepID=A0A3N5BDF9_9BACI|nr:aryl-alcohol dehydrogenase-like predicted oxidoreductase [Aquisalibacillus elongatus]